MNFTHLLTFVTVCKTGSFQRAANELYVTPSAVSQSIKTLEKELDCLLFTRSTRTLCLTEQGRVFFDYAKKMLALYQDALRDLQESRQHTPLFSLCLSSPNTDDYVQTALAQFYSACPQALISIEHRSPDEIQRPANWQNNTLYILSKEWLQGAKCYTADLFSFCRCCVMRADDPLAAKSAIALEDLVGRTYYLLDTALKDPARLERYGLQDYLDKIHFVNTNSVVTSFSKIIASGGVCVIPGYLTSYRQFGLVSVPMANQPETILAAASSQPFPREMKQFIRFLKQSLQRSAADDS
jgi:DNA-binding transcriptional LysR family regulator